jgi:transposase
LLHRSRPPADPPRTRRSAAIVLVGRVRRLDAEVAILESRLGKAITESRIALTELFGIGPILAGKILGRVGGVRHPLSAACFASYCWVAPI